MQEEENPASAADAMARARSHLDNGDAGQAETWARRAAARDPAAPDPVIFLATLASRRGDEAKRAEMLTRHLRAGGDDVRIHRQLVNALLRLGRNAEARDAALTLAEREDATARDLILLARSHLDNGDAGQAETWARRAAARDPAAPDPVIFLATLASRRGDEAARAEMLGQYLRAGGDDVRIHRQLVNALLRLGRNAEARDAALTLAESGAATARDLIILARIHLDNGDAGQAETWARRAAARDPAAPDPVLFLANLAQTRGDPEAELAMLMEGAQAMPANPDLRVRAANTLINLGREAEAHDLVAKADMDAMDTKSLYNLSFIHEKLGERALADTCIDRMKLDGATGAKRLVFDILNERMTAREALETHARHGLPADETLATIRSLARLSEGFVAVEDIVEDIGESLLAAYARVRAYFLPGFAPGARLPLVSALVPVHRLEDAGNAVRQVGRQSYPNLQVIFLISNDRISGDDLAGALGAMRDCHDVRVERFSAGTGLSRVLNAGLDLARGEYIAKIDADDLYLEDYLLRTVGLMRAQDADICGKPDVFFLLRSLDAMMLLRRSGDTFSIHPDMKIRHGTGSSMVFSRALADAIRFDERLKTGEDLDYYFRSQVAGFRLVLAPPFDHVVIRKTDGDSHSWRIHDARLIADMGAKTFLPAGADRTLELEVWKRLFRQDPDHG